MAAAAPSNWGAIGEIIADFVSGKGPNVSCYKIATQIHDADGYISFPILPSLRAVSPTTA